MLQVGDVGLAHSYGTSAEKFPKPFRVRTSQHQQPRFGWRALFPRTDASALIRALDECIEILSQA